jgi:hypothetical protein
MRTLLLALALVSTPVLFIAACDKGTAPKTDDKKTDDKKADDKSKTEDKAKPGDDKGDKKGDDKDDKKAADKPKLVDTDLSSRGKEWAGWTIQAPEGSKVMEDMSDLRVAGKPCPITDDCLRYDLILSQKKPDLKATKKIQIDSAKQFGDKVDITQDTADYLEWTRETMGVKTKNFEMVLKVGGKDISCHPMGGASDSDFDVMKDSCKTVAKK